MPILRLPDRQMEQLSPTIRAAAARQSAQDSQWAEFGAVYRARTRIVAAIASWGPICSIYGLPCAAMRGAPGKWTIEILISAEPPKRIVPTPQKETA